MRYGRINWKVLIVFLFAVIAFSATIWGLHHWNRNVRARTGIENGQAAFEQARWKEAAQFYGQYLSAISPRQDNEILMKYAQAQLNIRPVTGGQIDEALRAYHQVLRNEDNPEALRHVIELHLKLGQPADALLQVEKALEKHFDTHIACLGVSAQIQQRRYDSAYRLLTRIITKRNTGAEPYALLMHLLRRRPDLSSKPPLEWADEAIEKYPDDPMVYLIRADLYFSENRTDKAIEDLDNAGRMEITERKTLFDLCSARLRADQLDEAEGILSRLQKEESDDPALWNLWAQWALQTRSADTMSKIAEDGLVAVKSIPFDFLETAAILFIRSGRHNRAQDCIQQIRSYQPDSETVAYLEGVKAHALGQWTQAAQAWRKVLASQNKHAETQLNLAEALANMGDSTSAIQQIRSLLLQEPANAAAHAKLSELLAAEGRVQEALNHAVKTVQLQPDDAAAGENLLEVYVLLLRSKSADVSDEIRSFAENQTEKLLQKNPSPVAYLLAVRAELALSKPDEAQALLNRMKEAVGDCPQLYLGYAELLAETGRLEQAHQLLKNAREKYPRDLELLRQSIILHADKKQYAQAGAIIRDQLGAFAAMPEEQEAKLWLAELLILEKDAPHAETLLKQMAKDYPENIKVMLRLLNLTRKTEAVNVLQDRIDQLRLLEGPMGRLWRLEHAKLMLERGDAERDYPRVSSVLHELLRDFPEDQPARLLLAQCYEKMGEVRLAVSTYQEALQRDPDNLDLTVRTVSALYDMEDYRQAEEIINEVSRGGVQDSRISDLQLQKYMKQEKYSSALEILQEMVAEHPNNINLKLTLILILIQQEDFELASALLEEILVDNPDCLPAVAAKADLLIKRGQALMAVQICQQAVEKYNNPEAYTLQALTWAKLGESEKAEKTIIQMLEVCGSNLKTLPLCSDLYQYMGNKKKAEEAIYSAITLSQDDFYLLKKAVVLYAADSENDLRVKDWLEKALWISPADPELQLIHAGLMFREGTEISVRHAEDILNKLIFDYPSFDSAWLMLAEWNCRIGQSAKAMDQVLNGLSHNPDSKPLLLMKARLESERSASLAQPTLRLLYEKFPRDDQVTAAFAESLAQTDQPAKGVEILSARLQQTPDSVPLRLSLMNVLYAEGKKKESETLFAELLKIENGRRDSLSKRAQMLLAEKDWPALVDTLELAADGYPELRPLAAELYLKTAFASDARMQDGIRQILLNKIERFPQEECWIVALAKLYHRSDQLADAAQMYRLALQINPNQVEALNNLAWILAQDQENCPQALQLVHQGLAVRPDSIELLDTRGEIYSKMGRHDEAIDDFKQYITSSPVQSPEKISAALRLVRAYLDAGRISHAREELNRLKKQNQINHLMTDRQQQELTELLNIIKERKVL